MSAEDTSPDTVRDRRRLAGATTNFTREEVVTALRPLIGAAEAEAFARQAYDDPRFANNPGTMFSEDVLDALSLLSDNAARRVQLLMNLSDEEAARRRERMRSRLPRHPRI